MKFTIKPHSFISIITNSSSELFTGKMPIDQFKSIIEGVCAKHGTKYSDIFDEPTIIGVNCSIREYLRDYIFISSHLNMFRLFEFEEFNIPTVDFEEMFSSITLLDCYIQLRNLPSNYTFPDVVFHPNEYNAFKIDIYNSVEELYSIIFDKIVEIDNNNQNIFFNTLNGRIEFECDDYKMTEELAIDIQNLGFNRISC